MHHHRTQLLTLIALLAGVGAFLAYAHLDRQRNDALAARRDAQTVEQDLSHIAQATKSIRPVAAKTDASDLVRRIADVAAIAGVQLTDRGEPGIPQRIGQTQYSELPIFLGFESITMRQLTTFLNQLAQSDPGSRAQMIELRPREGAPSTSSNNASAASIAAEELWTADVTIAYLIHTPKADEPH
jgi:hypothetical protein